MSASISIVIPTYNEAEGIQRIVRYPLTSGSVAAPEIIVSDGGSTDHTPELAGAAGARVIQSPEKGRAAEINAGAAVATGDVLYFLHADTCPPAQYQAAIQQSCISGYGAGCFRLRFDDDHRFLQITANGSSDLFLASLPRMVTTCLQVPG